MRFAAAAVVAAFAGLAAAHSNATAYVTEVSFLHHHWTSG